MKKKHPNKAVKKYNHGIAAYPLEFYQYVISEKKICLQFKKTQLKTRPVGDQTDLRRTPHGTKELPIDTKATDVEVLAVGIPLDMYPELLQNIQEALDKHKELFESKE